MDPSIASFPAALDARPISGVQYRLVGTQPRVRRTDGDGNDIVGYVVPILIRLRHVRSSSFGAVLGTGVIGPIADGVPSGFNVTYKAIFVSVLLITFKKRNITVKEVLETYEKLYAVVDMTCVARAPASETPIPENPIP